MTGDQELRRADDRVGRLVADVQPGAATERDLGERRASALTLSGTGTNANDWVVVVSAPRPTLSLASLGVAPVAMLMGAVMLFALAWTQHRVNRLALQRASLHDELTGLPNRRLLADRTGQALRSASRRAERCGVLVLDLDRFKEINDTLGHAYGDALLKQLAERLTGVLREQDTLARLGGDEFALLLPGLHSTEDAAAAAQRVLDAIAEPFVVDDVTLDVEGSIGIAVAPDHGRDADVLMRCADVAMYEAKQAMSGVELYDPQRDTNTPLRLALLGDLRRALETDELYLHYQPKVELASGQVSGVEALLRWQHPVRGLVPPGDFIPVAEGTGLIHRLTMRTLELAVRQGADWSRAGRPLQIAVNLSARLLLDEQLPAAIRVLLEQHGLHPRLLRLELTESAVMTDPARALTVLQALRDVGVYLSIDDFGTGYSSMAYLKRLPVDELKVDRSFVMDMQDNDSDAVLVRSAIDLGHNLGLTVVAEGVEDAGTLHALDGLGCDVIQGFHLARPMSAEQVDVWRGAQPGVRDAEGVTLA
ncbi:MAG: EAL domain-containing protein [Actinomycetota bacterium]|nr:EAL domain-containing protein [Actinomycetota bacterium]